MTADRGRLTLVTRDDCTLCDAALSHLGPAARRLGVSVALADVGQDPDLEAAYGTAVPVLLAADGSVLASGRISMRQAWLAVLRARVARAG